MSSSVVTHGKISKRRPARTQKPVASDQFIQYVAETQPQVQTRRAKRIKKLADFDEVIKYLYISRGYNLDKLHEVMEIMFQMGATTIQYRGYVNRADFKKKVTVEEWTRLAPYFCACQELQKDVAVRINGLHTIKPSAVKKEIDRNFSIGQQALFRYQRSNHDLTKPLSFGRIEAYTPSSQALCQKIPIQLLKQLPIMTSGEHLLQICEEHIKQRYGSGKELSGVANSGYFEFLRVLLYRLSNNLFHFEQVNKLLDNITKFGYRSSLKALLSLDILSIKMAAENILPILVWRQDEELVDLIYRNQARSDTNAAWYKIFSCLAGSSPNVWESGSGIHIFFPVQTYHRGMVLDNTPEGLGNENKIPDAVIFISNLIVKYRMDARTAEDAAILLHLAIKYMLIEVSVLKTLLPSLPPDILDRAYKNIYEKSVLQIQGKMDLSVRLDLGFRKNLHFTMLQAILRNDIGTFQALLPHSNLKGRAYDGLGESVWDDFDGGGFIWDRLWMGDFNVVVTMALQEIGDDSSAISTGQESFDSSCLFRIAYQLQNIHLREFLLIHCRTYNSKESVITLLTSALWVMVARYDERGGLYQGTECSLCNSFTPGKPPTDKTAWKGRTEWCGWLIKNGADVSLRIPLDIREKLDISSDLVLHSLIGKPGWWDTAHLILRLGFDVNALDSNEKNPLDILVNIQSSECCADRRKFLEHLLKLGARITTKSGWGLVNLDAGFDKALTESNIDFLVETWTRRWVRIPPPVVVTGMVIENDDVDPICLDLVSWIKSPPNETDRKQRIEAFIALLKSSGLRSSTLSVVSDGHNDLRQKIMSLDLAGGQLKQLKRPWGRLQTLNTLQLLVVVAEPELLRATFSFGGPEALIQLQQEHPPNRLSPLHYMVGKGDFECLGVLLENGANPRVLWSRYSPLLFDQGQDRNNGLELVYEHTLLHYAIQHGDMNTARCLIEYGAFVPSRNESKGYIDGKSCTAEEWLEWRRKNSPTFSVSVVQLAVKLGRLDFLALLLHVDIDSRDEARAAAIEYKQSTILNWIDHHWMGKPRPDPPQILDRPGPEQRLSLSIENDLVNPDLFNIPGIL
ncbi:hypothetical protein EYR41_005965 [Orbilia oligospora]|uniref:Uncharacterized protein n=1 Tax=Orbilia oligospora TaxID=2813651 RepID=A0A7C8PYC7_ORBOL|nr:hypothetical protein TWF751_004199 [Orbilia oligospora]TGJ69963.1 hypothetical protein EYR41_005965 [Orbilia oligospora]